MIIHDRPNTEYNYEFEVILPWHIYENDEEVYGHCGYYENGFEAFAEAEKIHGLVIHNVRIAHKEKKNKPIDNLKKDFNAIINEHWYSDIYDFFMEYTDKIYNGKDTIAETLCEEFASYVWAMRDEII